MPNTPKKPSGVQEARTLNATPITRAPIGPITPTPIPPHPVPTPVPPSPGAPVALTPAKPSVTTNAPTSSVAVTVPKTTGKVTFALVVTDNLGVESAPAYVTVTIQGAPVAHLTAKPTTVGENGTIELSGGGSKSSGKIANYKFSLVPQGSPTHG